jgi:hypothetical protein
MGKGTVRAQGVTAVVFSHSRFLAREIEFIQLTQAMLVQDRINELTLKLQAAEVAAQQNSALAVKRQEHEESVVESSLATKAREQEVAKYKSLVEELEKKVRTTSVEPSESVNN